MAHFAVVYSVTWPSSESETGVDFALVSSYASFVSKQWQLQPRFHSKARSPSTLL